ncbi:hypothetical protein BJF79_28280 [Actinomadura sp. CNU-125]|nr:hypothetical protein BJF79_28280 [Actinomadura sp. CNU-125]
MLPLVEAGVITTPSPPSDDRPRPAVLSGVLIVRQDEPFQCRSALVIWAFWAWRRTYTLFGPCATMRAMAPAKPGKPIEPGTTIVVHFVPLKCMTRPLTSVPVDETVPASHTSSAARTSRAVMVDEGGSGTCGSTQASPVQRRMAHGPPPKESRPAIDQAAPSGAASAATGKPTSGYVTSLHLVPFQYRPLVPFQV